MASTPRWFSVLSEALVKDEKSVVFQLATTDVANVPHVRTHVFRQFLHVSSTPTIPIIITSTDIRTPKVTQITGNPRVELAWWIQGTQEQFRIAGHAYAVPVSSSMYQIADVDVSVCHALTALKREGFDWEAKRREVFDEMGGRMRASWCRPPPGQPLYPEFIMDPKYWPLEVSKIGEAKGEKEERDLEVASGNLALVVIEPNEVDYVELATRPNRRTRFTMNSRGEWKEEVLVP